MRVNLYSPRWRAFVIRAIQKNNTRTTSPHEPEDLLEFRQSNGDRKTLKVLKTFKVYMNKAYRWIDRVQKQFPNLFYQ